MISALEKIQKGGWRGTGKTPAYLLTHPHRTREDEQS